MKNVKDDRTKKKKVGGEKSPEKSSNRKTFSGLIILPSTLQNDRKLPFS